MTGDLFDLSPAQLTTVFTDLHGEPNPALCTRCMSRNVTGSCCTAHGVLLCHTCYRRTHFVEICGDGCGLCMAESLDPMARVR